MRFIVVLFCSILMYSTSWGIFGIEALKKTVNNNNNKIQTQNKSMMAELGVIKGNQMSFAAKLNMDTRVSAEARAQAQVGYGNKINEVSKEMRDNIQSMKVSFSKQMTKISNEMTNINKTITKTSIKQNQASIFYVLALILGIANLAQMVLLGYFISKFFENRMARIKYEQEIDDIRKGDKR